jgi:hypothetical protein
VVDALEFELRYGYGSLSGDPGLRDFAFAQFRCTRLVNLRIQRRPARSAYMLSRSVLPDKAGTCIGRQTRQAKSPQHRNRPDVSTFLQPPPPSDDPRTMEVRRCRARQSGRGGSAMRSAAGSSKPGEERPEPERLRPARGNRTGVRVAVEPRADDK